MTLHNFTDRGVRCAECSTNRSKRHFHLQHRQHLGDLGLGVFARVRSWANSIQTKTRSMLVILSIRHPLEVRCRIIVFARILVIHMRLAIWIWYPCKSYQSVYLPNTTTDIHAGISAPRFFAQRESFLWQRARDWVPSVGRRVPPSQSSHMSKVADLIMRTQLLDRLPLFHKLIMSLIGVHVNWVTA